MGLHKAMMNTINSDFKTYNNRIKLILSGLPCLSTICLSQCEALRVKQKCVVETFPCISS